MPHRPTIGILYPGHSAEDDYPSFEALLGGGVVLPVQHTLMNEDAHRLDALLDWGRPDILAAGVRAMRPQGIDAVMWACTSGSFAYGWEGAHEQVRGLADAAAVPASSTSLAFVAAVTELGVGAVAIAATYPADVAELFAKFLADAGIDVVATTGYDIYTAAEVGLLTEDRLVDLARSGDVPEAEAVLLPDTAFHTADHLETLEAALGKPVLTANQVTVWQALRLVGVPTHRPGLGRLFRPAG